MGSRRPIIVAIASNVRLINVRLIIAAMRPPLRRCASLTGDMRASPRAGLSGAVPAEPWRRRGLAGLASALIAVIAGRSAKAATCPGLHGSARRLRRRPQGAVLLAAWAAAIAAGLITVKMTYAAARKPGLPEAFVLCLKIGETMARRAGLYLGGWHADLFGKLS